MDEVKVLLEIIKSFLEEKEYIVTKQIEEEKLYDLAKKHKMSNFLIKWAKKDCVSEEIKAKIQADFNQQIMKDTNENIEFQNILDQFEEAKVKTLVFKGFIMKNVYPQNYMRQMCDIDLLVAQDDFKEALLLLQTTLNYIKLENSEHHLVLVKKPFFVLELHRKLIFGEEIGYQYFNEKVWDFCIPYQTYENIYQMTIEDTYVFCMTHLIRHFKSAGIKIRDVLDVYLYYEKYKDVFDYDKLNQKLDEFGIRKFEENMRRIAYKWFGEEEIKDFDEAEQFILQGASVYNQVNFEVGNKGGKMQYLMRRIFPEFKVIKRRYPILEKVPILLPVAWLIRILEDIFSTKTTMKERIGTIKLIKEANLDEVSKMQEIYKELGIIRKED